MKILEYCNKKIFLTAFNSAVEKDLLLYISTNDNASLDAVFWMLRNNIEPFGEYSDYEKLAIITELRSISVGEVYELKMKCQHCQQRFEFGVQLNNIIQSGKLGNSGNSKDFKGIKVIEAFSSNYNDFCPGIDIDDLDTDIYDELIEYIEDNKTKFNFSKDVKCEHCQKINTIVFNKDILFKNISEDSIENYYKTISSLVYNGKYSKLDLDSMLPFERNIYLGLLNEEIKAHKNAKQGVF